MWVRIASDLHLEFRRHQQVSISKLLPPDKRDSEATLILAGDIVTSGKMHDYFPLMQAICRQFKEVVYITGNHEYYHSSFEATHFRINDYYVNEIKNFTFLNNSSVSFGDVVIWGATLWTDMNKHSPLCIMESAGCMPEYGGHVYWKEDEIFKPEHSVKLHNESLFYMREFFRDLKEHQKVIIMTHHAPSYESVGARFKDSDINGAFTSELSHEILEREPILWVHGHMHDPSDYMIGKTRIVCNPYGYPNEKQDGGGFNDTFFIEV